VSAAPWDATYASLLVRREEDLLWVTLNNPEKANALSLAMIREVTELYRRPLRKHGIRAVLLQGAGKHFCAGADLTHLRSLKDATPQENLEDSQRLRGLFEAVLRQDALTVALVHGSCVAGGCGLATAHDYVVADSRARFLYSEVKIGFVAALVATFLPLRLRGSHIREVLLNPQLMGAEEALSIGLINRITEDSLEEAGQDLAAEVLANASSESIARTKGLLLDLIGRPLGNAMGHAAQVNADARSTGDCKHGIATFLESKKPPKWR
jgi:methylglutaconyl-CoA hydratase